MQRREVFGSIGEKSKNDGEENGNNSAATDEIPDPILEGELAKLVFQDAAEKFEGK